MNYENGNLLFKILYDKIYRKSLYNYINNSDINVPNKTRTFISFNKDNFDYKALKKNEEFISENDDDVYTENIYLLKSQEIFRISLINKYSSFFFLIILCGGLIFQKKSVLVFSGVGLMLNGIAFSRNNSKKNDLTCMQRTSLFHFQDKLIYSLYKTIYNEN